LSVLSQSSSNPRTSKLIRMRVTFRSFSFLMARAFGGDPTSACLRCCRRAGTGSPQRGRGAP
jgi:hypothetical protein